MPDSQENDQTIDVAPAPAPEPISVEDTLALPPEGRDDTYTPARQAEQLSITQEIESGATATPQVPEDHTIDLGSTGAPLAAATLDHTEPGLSDTDNVDFALGPVKREPGPAPIPTVMGYRILSVLGRGGMGVVYKARQEKLNRLVALKMVIGGAHASPHQLARFFTEAEAVARLQHQNIVQIYEVGEHDGLPFFSLEYVDGGTLSQSIDGKPRPPREAAATVELLARAMAAAHERGIMHRDLKPANVLVTSEGKPKITDFGLAKRLEDDSSQTKSGTLMGTPSYMSPEQARGETREIGPLSDLYSLGAILYELLTGRPPFVGTTVVETLLQVRNQEPVPPTRLQPKCPRDLETICLKCLQKEPHQRYSSCASLADDLHRFLAGEPIRARPIGWIERSWRWCRRNPRVASLSASVGVLVLLVIAAVAAILVRMGRERENLAETRRIAEERLQQATERIALGNYQQAQDTLKWSDPLLTNADLADVRSQLEKLRASVEVYAEFHKLLDRARFDCRFGSLKEKEEGKRTCDELLKLYGEIESRTGRGSAGLPPLGSTQLQLFHEDVFEALLTAAQVERELAQKGDKAAQQQAAARELSLFARAEAVLPGTRALLAHRAPSLTKVGKDKAAKADLEKAKRMPPTSAVDHFWHGFAEQQRGDEELAKKDTKKANDYYRSAIAEYAAFLQQRPDHFWGYFNWAHAHVQLWERTDLFDALVGFTACIRLRPDLPWSYNNRGTVHLRLRMPEQALVDYGAALALKQNFTQAVVNRGLAYLALRKPNLAEGDFSRALGLDPGDPKIREHRAVALEAQGKFQGARQDLTWMIDHGCNQFTIWWTRAVLNWQKLKEFDAALADFEKCKKLEPDRAEPYRCIGVILLGRHKYPEAEEALQQALARKPGYPDATWALAQIYQHQGKLERALELIDPLIANLPQGPPASLNIRADVYKAMGRPNEAAEDYRRMIAANPEQPEAYVCLAGIYQKQGNSAKAAACFEQLLKASKGSKWAFLRRAEYRRDQRDFAGAEADCREAEQRDKAWPLPALVRASVLAARGEPQRAVTEAERLLARTQNHDGHVLYAAACVWSLAAGTCRDLDQRKRYADRAADLLAQTLDKGFHDLIYPEHNRMADDPALAPIRDLPRVRTLLGGMS